MRTALPAGSPASGFPELPPHLRPAAVLSAALPPSRLRIGLLAAAAYAALGGALLLVLGGVGRVLPPPLHPGTLPWKEFVPVLLPSGVERARAASRGPARGKEVVRDPQAQPDLDRVPDRPPEGLPENLGTPPAGPFPFAGASAPTGGDGVPGATAPGSGDGARVVELDSRALRILHQVPPEYPPLARAAGIQGPVELLMLVDTAGTPREVRVLSGHPAFHAEAERAARLWRFEPPMVDGTRVQARFLLRITFRLRSGGR
ncbi:MAG: energy transducer TonB [Acidobacteria bacterium]|nr:energy transducer TonB [Acidobacteriota bacterium]